MNPGVPAPAPAAPAQQPSFTPEAFGKYYLVDRIAMGGMAEIFKAKTFGVGGFENLLVIKRILAHLSENDQFVRMFMDEAKVSALLQNSNIVRIYDFGKLRTNYFIAMECVEGKDVKLILRKLAERRKLLPREFAVYIAMEAAKGLDYAHKRTTLQGQPLNIVHRDVSPSNLLVSYHGEVKVADFGIVKAANTVESTDAGTLKGKFEYMSPEQAQGLELDRRSDIFSLGIILWEMLTGRRAFKSESEIRTLERIKTVDIEYPSAVNPQVPARLDEIVMRALAKDPDDRHQDARELHADLIEFLYPASPDLTQQSLAHFMTELFSEETSRERDRLEEGSRLALALHESSQMVELEPDWEEGAPSHGTTARGPAPQRPSRTPLLVFLFAVLAVMMVVAGVVVYPMLNPPPAAAPVDGVPKEVQPTVGAVELQIAPVAGRVTFDGELEGEGTAVTVGDLDPTRTYAVRVEADGYLPYDYTLTPSARDRVVQVTLVPVPAPTPGRTERVERPAPTPTPAPAATKAVARFTSNPSGADVFVDGRLVGKTPVSWDDGDPGGKYTVEYRLNGYDSMRFSAALPGNGGTEGYDRTLQERAKGEGKLNVNISGGGWGDIYINDKKVGTTPKFGIQLGAGTYTVRVKNDSTGLDQTRTVTVKSGETQTASFSAE
jgi:serine/threonine protein kinase